MSSDLWGPSSYQDDSSYYLQPWQCGLYFSYGFDIIEENALNEMSCIQVLRIWITKADSEIDELEKDLVSLQSELAWTESEEWFDLCCNALRSKIESLDISVRKLRNKDESDIEVYLLMHTEPAEELHIILKALLKSFFHEKDEQNEQSQDVVVGSSCGAPEQLPDLHKNQNSSTSDSLANEGINGPSVALIENFPSSNSCKELEEKKANHPQTLEKARVKDLIPHSLAPAANQFDEKEVVISVDLETSKNGIKDCGLTIIDRNVIQHSSSKSAQKRMHSLDGAKVKELAVQVVSNSDMDASTHSADHLYKKKKLDASSAKNMTEEASADTSLSAEDILIAPVPVLSNSVMDASTTHSADHLYKKKKLDASSIKSMTEEAFVDTSILASDILILDLSSTPMGKGADLSKKVKDEEQPANIIAKDLGSATLKQTTGDSNEKTLFKLDLKVKGCEVPGLYKIGKSRISNSCLNPEHKGNILKTDKPANDEVKTISPDTLRHATGRSVKGNSTDSMLGACGHVESVNCDMEQKLCDFALKSARRRGIKELKAASTDKKGLSSSLFKGEGKIKDTLLVLKQKETVLSHNEQAALTSLVELQIDGAEDKTIQQMEGKPQLEDLQVGEIAAGDDKLAIDLCTRPQIGKAKTVKENVESTSASVEEPGLESKENVSNSSPISKGKRPRKYANNQSLNYSVSGENIKKTVQHGQCEAQEQCMMLDASKKTARPPKKKCKVYSPVPYFLESKGSPEEMSKLHGDLNGSTAATDFSVSKDPAFAISNLMNLKLCDLKEIARV